MYVAFNELSLHGQHTTDDDVAAVLQLLLSYRKELFAAEAALFVRRVFTQRPIDVAGTTLDKWLQNRPRQDSLVRALRIWLDKNGPFLDDDLEHNSGATYECDDDTGDTHLITDCAIAEVAERARKDPAAMNAVISLTPSRWQRAGIDVRSDAWGTGTTAVENIPSREALIALIERARPLRSWSGLRDRAIARCTNLTFVEGAFDPLMSEPFNVGAADRLLLRLLVLDVLKSRCTAATLDSEGMRIRREHFEGDKAWFSDSSEGEKVDFRKELTFKHPIRPGEQLFCPWHGKVKTPQLRIHYYDRFSETEPLYIVYVGPKITKR